MLYNKYRPQSLDEVFGNQDTIASIKADLTKKDKPHAILLHGPYGCSKTSLGRIIASMLGCHGSDFTEIDSGQLRSIDTIREIRQQSQFKPIESNCRVWLLDEIAQLPKSIAQPAMLKMLEDPLPHCYYILATTDPSGLIPTVRSRCTEYSVSLLNDRDMYKLLRSITTKEGQTLEKDIYDQIIASASGHPRDAIQYLDQVLAVEPSQRLAVAKKVQYVENTTLELCRALMTNAPWKKVAEILKNLKDEEEESIRRAVLGYCSSTLLNGENDRAAMICDEFIQPFYSGGWPQLVWSCYKVIKI